MLQGEGHREGKRQSLFVRLAIVLLVILGARLLYPLYEERLRPVTGPIIEAVNAVERRIGWTTAEPTPPVRQPTPPVKQPATPPPVKQTTPQPPAKEPQVVRPVDPEAEKELAAARQKMVAPPPGTAEALTQADPRQLARALERGTTAYNDAQTDDERLKGVRMILVAAALGYGPARGMIVRSYPRSRVLRTVATPNDVVRFALDPFADTSQPDTSGRGLTTLATYFVEQGKAEELATALVDALSEDKRLQDRPRAEPVFDALTKAPGACKALAEAVKLPGGAADECLSSLKTRTLEHVRSLQAAKRDEALRRRALTELRDLVK